MQSTLQDLSLQRTLKNVKVNSIENDTETDRQNYNEMNKIIQLNVDYSKLFKKKFN
jgi:hypothetical protein